MKQKLTIIVLGALGLSFFTGCCCVQKRNLRCLPCENARASSMVATPAYTEMAMTPAPAPVPAKPMSTCIPCQRAYVEAVQPVPQYVAPTPVPAPKPDCLNCVDGKPDYSKYQWY
jgi:hypothetical protein